ncbi:MAG: WecB/TagA/CpsF family glycosyltransferase [Dialister invisus]
MDVRIHAVTMEEALRCAREMAASGEEHIIATANAEMVMIARKIRNWPCVEPLQPGRTDGAGILWAGEQLGTYFPARVAGADYAEEILKIAVKEKWPVYFLGGAPGVAETAIRRFTERYGPFEKAGFHDGYFDEIEEQKIVEEIKSGGTKVLLCGMGVPKQEKWLTEP